MASAMQCQVMHALTEETFTALSSSIIFDIICISRNQLQKHPCNTDRLGILAEFATVVILGNETDDKTRQIIPQSLQEKSISSVSVQPEQILPFAEKLYHERQSRFRQNYLNGEMDPTPGIEALITNNPYMAEVVDGIKSVARTDSTVLISGETGTGKELIASIIHNCSQRKSGPFMAINCGALPDTLLESELFGHERGSFSGAFNQRIGKLEYANGGTLFLDELESMSSAMQVRLLRVIQEQKLQRLGNNKDTALNLRIIAATNIQPQQLLDSRKLRSDLYYRLAVYPLTLPPLRHRLDDISLLTTHFFNKKRTPARSYVEAISPEVLQRFTAHRWPGNIRELQNVIERALLKANGPIITPGIIEFATASHGQPLTQEISDQSAFSPGLTLKEYKSKQNRDAERKYLIELLEYTKGRIGESARHAGLSPRAMYSKMQAHGLRKEYFRQSEARVPERDNQDVLMQ
ncbi:sigma-54 interaction domain-containing protein [Desulfogranum japonicum]|uniref:sigma-54 interaction domain-containing protein n=1 Tax=Desulfogranum japonicum TaxID=231447 RepID=UPI0013787B4B|nr:sigma-54 dependent transcriptional regulator [Desulfogranum japonicum]